ncbi:hypothetical protein PGTUg99_033098 [Puccinia graminis f. sp. tritici]|uniref:Uncharacterized protein n=1 Tax=Puccinia graminis f. sp. tritici TaxID=56615 RepID=A0A5B0RWS1_PUCGR|nr:hypothetical protein PGTUg99_033098 [Puccinia graminis f. sp. tritici]
MRLISSFISLFTLVIISSMMAKPVPSFEGKTKAIEFRKRDNSVCPPIPKKSPTAIGTPGTPTGPH